MNESRVIALRFRPKTFDQVVGQEAIVRTLTNAIKSGGLHHAYLFGGARGVGKTTTARLLAKALNCAQGPTTQPCGVCPSCLDISDSRSMLVTEIDAASNTSVENVRQVIVNSTTFSPPANQYRVFIIDEVHQLSGAAFNALLKTIEEPPPRVIFIMATTELQKVPDTILSRCQVFEFRTIPLSKVFAELRRIAGELGITISDSALGTIARAGEGSMRDAESAFDQVISFAGNDISDEDVSVALGLPSFETLRAALEAIADQDSQAILRIVDTIVTRGYDIRNFCREVMTYVRNLLIVKVTGFDQELTQMPQSEAEWTERLADRFSDQDLIRFFSILSKTEQDIRQSSQPRFQLEIGLVKMAQASRLYLLEDAIDRMAAIEAGLRGEAPPGRPQRTAPTTNRPPSYDREATTAGTLPKPPAGPHNPGAAKVTPARGRAPETPAPRGRAPETTAAAEPTPEPTAARAPASDTPAAQRPEFHTTTAKPASLRPGSPDELSANRPEAHSPGGLTDPPASKESASETADAPKENLSTAIEKVKKVLESHKKIMLSIALDKAENVSIDGQRLLVKYAPPDRHYQTQIEDARRAIEEACYEALGLRLTLSASSGGLTSPTRQTSANVAAQAAPKPDDPKPENHPAVRAIIERFNGEIIDVDIPER